MTCIVGYVDKETGIAYLGGDSAGVDGYYLRKRKDPKVFKNGEFMFGFTSSFRMGQLLMIPFDDLEKQPKNMDDFHYLLSIVVPYIIKRLEKNGFSKIKENEKKGGTFLMVYKNQLYNVQDDFQIEIVEENYNAVGCGYAFALGTLRTLEDIDVDSVDKVTLALENAEYFSAGVSAPFRIISSNN